MPDDDNVTKLPVRFKEPAPPDRTLVFPREVGQTSGCDHYFNCHYVVDEAKSEVECGRCHEKLNPMWVLKRLCSSDARMQKSHRRYKEEMARLAERSRTQCDHCGKFTRISRR